MIYSSGGKRFTRTRYVKDIAYVYFHEEIPEPHSAYSGDLLVGSQDQGEVLMCQWFIGEYLWKAIDAEYIIPLTQGVRKVIIHCD